MYKSSSNWQISRGRFNHDWLKNQYIPALESFRNIQKGQVQRANLYQDFWEIDLPQWETHRIEAYSLIMDFEICMSPRILLDEIPLCGFDSETKAWMGIIINTLWSARLSVPDLKRHASACLKKADRAYEALQAGIRAGLNTRSSSALSELFEDFRSACHDLARAFEQFPSNIRVV